MRYVLSREWLAEAGTKPGAEDVAVSTVYHRVLRGRGWACSRDRKNTFKVIGWLLHALRRWHSTYYGKTEDDAIVDFGPLLTILSAAPRGPVAAGAIRYSCLNTSTLACGGRCFALGAQGGLDLRAQGQCRGDVGPFPFLLGPLELLSHEVLTWATPKLEDLRGRMLATAAACPAEDPLLGFVLSGHPNVSLVDLSGSVGGFDVISSPSRWSGAPSFLAHRVGTEQSFRLARRDFNVSRHISAGFDRYCETRTTTFRRGTKKTRARKWHAIEQRRFCTAAASGRLRLPCQKWLSVFSALNAFPCCHGWDLCETPRPLPFPTRFTWSARESR